VIHLLCAALVLLGLVVVDLRAHRRAVAILTAINPLRSGDPIEDDEGDEGEDEGGMLATIEFGDEGEPPTAVVALTLDASTTERVDEAVAAVRETGDRPSGERAAYVPPERDDDPA